MWWLAIVYKNDGTKMFATSRRVKLYKIDMNESLDQMASFLMSEKEYHWLWHIDVS